MPYCYLGELTERYSYQHIYAKMVWDDVWRNKSFMVSFLCWILLGCRHFARLLAREGWVERNIGILVTHRRSKSASTTPSQDRTFYSSTTSPQFGQCWLDYIWSIVDKWEEGPSFGAGPALSELSCNACFIRASQPSKTVLTHYKASNTADKCHQFFNIILSIQYTEF